MVGSIMDFPRLLYKLLIKYHTECSKSLQLSTGRTSTEMEVASILTVLVLNIFLPTLDTYTDISLVTKLFDGAHNSQVKVE